ncbi:MAG: hypothetical protein ABIS59_02950, partial [Candidatus Saccharibacteria bacterium]
MKIAVAALAVCSFGLVACTNPQAPHPQSIATQKSEESPAPLVEATTPDEVTSDVLPEITSDSDGRSVCLSFSDHKLEICTAYVVNASLESRLPFYKLGRSTAVGYYKAVQEHCTGKSAGAAADCRLKSRYY